MYKIILHTWYQESPDEIFKESYNDMRFESLPIACEFLGENYEKILDEFPVVKIEITI